MAGLVLDLGHQLQLALEGRRAGDPVAFRQHADDFRVGVLGNLPDQRLAIGIGHPVLRLDLDLGVDLLLEGALFRRHLLQRLHAFHAGLNQLCVHAVSPAFLFVQWGGLGHGCIFKRYKNKYQTENNVSYVFFVSV
ncbi:hypothetical protein D3C78_1507880 [compost metagenome]